MVSSSRTGVGFEIENTVVPAKTSAHELEPWSNGNVVHSVAFGVRPGLGSMLWRFRR
jgi:hypothetical protein